MFGKEQLCGYVAGWVLSISGPFVFHLILTIAFGLNYQQGRFFFFFQVRTVCVTAMKPLSKRHCRDRSLGGPDARAHVIIRHDSF